jgi:hypothetical protein
MWGCMAWLSVYHYQLGGRPDHIAGRGYVISLFFNRVIGPVIGPVPVLRLGT